MTAQAGDVYGWAKEANKPNYKTSEITINQTAPAEGDYAAAHTDQQTIDAALAEIYSTIESLTGGGDGLSLTSLQTAINLLNNKDASGTTSETPLTGSVVKTVNDAVAAEAARIDAITGTPTGTTLKTDIDAVADDVATLNGNTNVVGSVDQKIDTAITNLNLGTTYAGKAYESKVDTLVGTDTNKSVRTIANEELAAQLIPANATESLDTLQEIAAWIQAHPGDASAMNAAITALQTKTELGTYDNNGTPTQYATVKAYVEAAIAALNIGDYALAADLTTLAGRVTTLEGKMTTAEGAIDGLDTAVGELDDRLDTVEGDITTLKGDNTTTGSVAKTVKDAIDGLATVAKTGNINDLQQTSGDVLILQSCNASGVFPA